MRPIMWMEGGYYTSIVCSPTGPGQPERKTKLSTTERKGCKGTMAMDGDKLESTTIMFLYENNKSKNKLEKK